MQFMLMGAFSPSGIGAPVLIEDLSKLDNRSCPSEGCHLVCPSKEGSCNLPLPKLGSRDKTHDSGHNWDFGTLPVQRGNISKCNITRIVVLNLAYMKK